MTKKVTISVCSKCGSDDILFDAWASFNPVTEEHELDNVFDNSFCQDCDQECGTVSKEIEVEVEEPEKPWVCECCNEELSHNQVGNYCPNCGEQTY